jgi:hypothetical protein
MKSSPGGIQVNRIPSVGSQIGVRTVEMVSDSAYARERVRQIEVDVTEALEQIQGEICDMEQGDE